MKSIRNALLAIAAVTVAYISYSPAVSAESAWTARGKITQVLSHNGFILVYTTITGTPSCPGSTGMYYWVARTQVFADHKEMYALVLTAYLGDTDIAFLAHDADCFGPFTGVTHANIFK